MIYLQAKRLILVIFAGFASAEAQIKIRDIIPLGEPVPGGTRGEVYTNLRNAALNGNGQIILVADQESSTRFPSEVAALWDRGGLVPVLRSNDMTPTLPAIPGTVVVGNGDPIEMPRVGGFDLVIGGPSDSWYLEARLGGSNVSNSSGPDVILNGVNSEIGFYAEGGRPIAVVPLQGAAFTRTVVNNEFRTERISINGILAPIFFDGMPAPGAGEGVTFILTGSGSLQFNAHGRVASIANLEGPGIEPSNQQALYQESPGDELELLVQAGKAHPETTGLATGGIFADLGQLSLNDEGDLAFLANITSPEDPDTATLASIWTFPHDESAPRFVSRINIPLPVEGRGPVTFDSIGSPLLTRSGGVIFSGLWRDGPEFRNGIFRWNPSDAKLSIVMQNGDPVDGQIAGLTLNSGNIFVTTPSGRVAMKGGVTKPGGGFLTAIIAQRADGSLYAPLLQGEEVAFTDGSPFFVPNELTFPLRTGPGSNGMDGQNVIFNDRGRLLVRARTQTNGDSRLIAVDLDFNKPGPPPPTGVAAGSTQEWARPEVFQKVMTRESNAAEQALVTAFDESVPVDLASLTGLSASDLNKLKQLKKFPDDPREFAKAYLQARRNVLKAISIMSLDEPAHAAWLLESFRNGRLLFGASDSGPIRSFAEIHADASPLCGKEPVILKFIPCGELKCYDPDFVQMMNSLLHESLHASQSFPPLASVHTALEQATWARDRHIHEIEASCAELDRMQELTRALLGQPSSPFAEKIVSELDNTLSGAEQVDARKKLEARILKIRRNALETKRCRNQYEEALDRFLLTSGTETDAREMSRQLSRLNWFVKFSQTRTAFGEIGIFGGGAVFNQGTGTLDGDPSVRQLNTETAEETSFVPTGAEYIYDGELSPDESKLYIAAKVGIFGKIYRYEDLDLDGYFDSSSESVVAELPEWVEGVLLTNGFDEESLAAFAQDEGTIYSLDPETGNITFTITPGSLLDNGLSFGTSGDNFVISPMPEGDAVTPDLREVVVDPDGEDDPNFRQAALRLAAILDQAPVAGDSEVTINGQPGQRFQIRRSDGTFGTMDFREGVIGESGWTEVPLEQALELGERIQIYSPDTDQLSFPFPVWNPENLRPQIGFFGKAGVGNASVEMSGLPGRPYTLLKSVDSLDTFSAQSSFQMGDYGSSVKSQEFTESKVFLQLQIE